MAVCWGQFHWLPRYESHHPIFLHIKVQVRQHCPNECSAMMHSNVAALPDGHICTRTNTLCCSKRDWEDTKEPHQSIHKPWRNNFRTMYSPVDHHLQDASCLVFACPISRSADLFFNCPHLLQVRHRPRRDVPHNPCQDIAPATRPGSKVQGSPSLRSLMSHSSASGCLGQGGINSSATFVSCTVAASGDST